jgi:aspartate/methionine/tyrosine aminotransferase
MAMELNPIEQCCRRLAAEGRPPLKLFQGNPTLHGIHFPQDILQEAYARALEHPRYDPDPKGLYAAREAIAKLYAAEQWRIPPEHILLTSGTSESFFFLFSHLAQPGDHFLAPLPTYPLFEHLARYARVNLRYYRLEEERNWEIDLEQLQSLADERTRGVILISPHNPTGATPSTDTLEPLVRWCNQRNIPLICDEVFAPFYFGPGNFPRPASVTKPELCFTLNGLSKWLALPGCKLGWISVTGREPKVQAALDDLEIIADTFLSVHHPIQLSLPDLLSKSGAFRKDYRREVQSRWETCRALLQKIPGLKWVAPRGGFYLTVRVTGERERSEERWVMDLMEQKGVFVHPGYFFDLEDGIHFVFTYLTRPDILSDALRKIDAFIQKK